MIGRHETDLEGSGCTLIKILVPGGTEENHEHFQSEQLMSGQDFNSAPLKYTTGYSLEDRNIGVRVPVG
jgi:hypothetical protein